jgi:hypothetical protein
MQRLMQLMRCPASAGNNPKLHFLEEVMEESMNYPQPANL